MPPRPPRINPPSCSEHGQTAVVGPTLEIVDGVKKQAYHCAKCGAKITLPLPVIPPDPVVEQDQAQPRPVVTVYEDGSWIEDGKDKEQ